MAEKCPVQESKEQDIEKWVAQTKENTCGKEETRCECLGKCTWCHCSEESIRQQAVDKLPATIGQLTFKQWDIVKTLNGEDKLSRGGYSYLADEFGYKAQNIVWLSEMKDPVGKILSEHVKESSFKLIDALLKIGRTEIVRQLADDTSSCVCRMKNDISENLELRRMWSAPEKSSQPSSKMNSTSKHRSLDETASLPSENQDLLGDSWNSSMYGEFVCQDIGPEEYHSEDSKRFWDSIDGHVQEKKFSDFWKAVENLFKDDRTFATKRCIRVKKFIAKVLDTKLADCDSSYIKRLDFVHLVASFGPAVATKDGCFEKIFSLMTKSLVSVTRDNQTEKESWFAGKMTTTESHEHVKQHGRKEGDFLIRFSESRASDGYFVLAFKTNNEGPVEIQIENDPKTQTLTLGRRTFNNLPDLVRKCRMDYFSSHEILLAQPCANLGMTAVCKGYVECGTPKRET